MLEIENLDEKGDHYAVLYIRYFDHSVNEKISGYFML